MSNNVEKIEYKTNDYEFTMEFCCTEENNCYKACAVDKDIPLECEGCTECEAKFNFFTMVQDLFKDSIRQYSDKEIVSRLNKHGFEVTDEDAT
jgi:hypothetical protein